MAESKKAKRGEETDLHEEPVLSKRLWPLTPPARAPAPLIGREVCCQMSVHRHSEIWLSTAASDWLSSPPRPRSFYHCRQESEKTQRFARVSQQIVSRQSGIWFQQYLVTVLSFCKPVTSQSKSYHILQTIERTSI